MDKDAIKKIAIDWLDDGINAMAMKNWVKVLETHSQWEADMYSQGKNPSRMVNNRRFFAKREGMAEIIDLYLTDWLDGRGHTVDYRLKQDVFSMAHQLLTGKEKIEG